MIRNKNGFTLIEMLVVLSGFLILSSITLILLKPNYSILDKQLFFTQLKSDLYFAQQYAISHQREVTVSIIPEQHFYYIRERGTTPIIVERDYSKKISVMEASIPLNFQFLPDGNVSRFGSFLVRMGNKTYRFTLLIGKGRFYVAEE
jgi:competence protein ComGD